MRLIDRHANTYVPPRPRMGLDRPAYRWRTLGWLLLACAALTGTITFMLR